MGAGVLPGMPVVVAPGVPVFVDTTGTTFLFWPFILPSAGTKLFE